MPFGWDDVRNYAAGAIGGGSVGAVAGALQKNKTAKEFAAKAGFGKSQAQKDADANLDAAKQAYSELEPPDLTRQNPEYMQTSDAGDTEFGGISLNPQDRQVQLDQIGALRSLQQNGGRSAAGDADLAQIQGNAAAAARGQRDAIVANANARGMGGSGASLLAQLDASQNQTNNQSMQDMQVAGQDQQNALAAGMGAAQLGSNMQQQDYSQQANKAAAQDAINKFNSGQKTQANQYNAGVNNAAQQYNTGLEQTGYQNKFQNAAAVSGTNMAGVNYNQAQANMGAQQTGNIMGAAVKAGSAGYGAYGGGAAHGGEIPGHAMVRGDSPENDTQHWNLSAGEVVVPRSMTHASSQSIGDFVHHAPMAGSDPDKEARAYALRHLQKGRC